MSKNMNENSWSTLILIDSILSNMFRLHLLWCPLVMWNMTRQWWSVHAMVDCVRIDCVQKWPLKYPEAEGKNSFRNEWRHECTQKIAPKSPFKKVSIVMCNVSRLHSGEMLCSVTMCSDKDRRLTELWMHGIPNFHFLGQKNCVRKC